MYGYLELMTLALIPGFILLDLVYRKRRYPTARFWRLRSTSVTIGIVLLTTWVAGFWGRVFDGVSLFDLGGLGIVGGAAAGFLVYEFVHYWYHRALHESDALWPIHQMHHSAESLDAFGANYIHPVDGALFATWSSLVFFPLLGLRVEAGILAALFVTFSAMFQHANIPTPHWLGYLIQRPESHNLHHARGVHRNNYADLPLWDMAFGTFRNSRTDDAPACGFYDGASGRVAEMLVGRDVSRPREGELADTAGLSHSSGARVA
jgi:sterol desaturase/sphingolipid hydroxylase (fatty acid hydroxylase superfamily)